MSAMIPIDRLPIYVSIQDDELFLIPIPTMGETKIARETNMKADLRKHEPPILTGNYTFQKPRFESPIQTLS